MSLLNDLTDAIKKRLTDPPTYEETRKRCNDCYGSGVCNSCNGVPSHHGKYAAISVGAIGLCLSLSSCGVQGWNVGFLWLSGGIALMGFINLFWHCPCQASAFNDSGIGQCVGCNGMGFQLIRRQTGGTRLVQALHHTIKASRLAREARTHTGISFEEIEQKIDQALDLNPDHFAANAIKGVLYYDRGDYLSALQHLGKAESRMPNSAEIKQALCAIHEEMGHSKVAELKYVEAVALGTKAIHRKQVLRNVAVGGMAVGLVGLFVPFLDE